MLNESRFRRAVLLVCSALCFTGASTAQRGPGGRFQDKVRAADASVLLLDVTSGKFLLQLGDLNTKAAPGSVLKPLVLMAALQSGVIRAHDSVACRGTLVMGGHNLACSHPRDITVVDARQALAASCNTYFATLAERMLNSALVADLEGFGLTPIQTPRSGEDRALLALGLQGVRVSARQVGAAYARLAQELNAEQGGTANAVREGLLQSVASGMANAARVNTATVGGKTGTVDDKGGRSHGWFAGIVFADGSAVTARRVIVVFVPNGNGADAASLAGLVLARGGEGQ